MAELSRRIRRYLTALVRRFLGDQPATEGERIVFGALRALAYNFTRRLA